MTHIMLLTLTPNPSLDRLIVAPAFRNAEVCRIAEVREFAGGKGLNVTRAAQTLGVPVRALAPLGGMIGQRVQALAQDGGFDGKWTWLETGETRTCLLVTDADAPDTLTLNERGPQVSHAEWEAFASLVLAEASNAAIVASSGSLPPGVPVASFVAMLNKLVALEKPVLLDTSGAALAAAFDLPLALVKANADEVSEALGQPISTVPDAVTALKNVVQRSPQSVLITLGASGALLVTPEDTWHAIPPHAKAITTVGSGDAAMAGFAAGLLRGLPAPEALRLAVACGTANTLTLGPAVIRLEDVEQLTQQTRLEHLL